MSDFNPCNNPQNKQQLLEIAQSFIRSSIDLLDIRCQTIAAHKPLQAYKMPSSMFVLTFDCI